MLSFEDFRPGHRHDLDSITLTEEEIVDYARRFDPMPFHLDRAAAESSPFGGLVASGWHTGALVMRGFVTALLADSACQGSYGMDEVRFLAPVRPGDELRGRVTVEAADPHPRRPALGVVHFLVEADNRSGTPVYRMRTRLLFARRAPAGGDRE